MTNSVFTQKSLSEVLSPKQLNEGLFDYVPQDVLKDFKSSIMDSIDSHLDKSYVKVAIDPTYTEMLARYNNSKYGTSIIKFVGCRYPWLDIETNNP